jgi:hypothetical protein
MVARARALSGDDAKPAAKASLSCWMKKVKAGLVIRALHILRHAF